MHEDWRIDFVIAGAQKCGTTTLDAMLRAHPDIIMCNRKEAHFFDRPASGRYDEFHKMFPQQAVTKTSGEATPSYIYVDGAMERLSRYNPHLKIIVILRDPAMRAYSHWNMLRQRGETALSFGQAIRREHEFVPTVGDFASKKFAFLARGRYARQLKTMLTYFPPRQCLVMKYETLFQDVTRSMHQITEFLGVEGRSTPERRERAGSYEQPIERIDVEFIANVLRNDLQDLAQLVDFDISDWPCSEILERLLRGDLK